jgi:hypothetical protein
MKSLPYTVLWRTVREGQNNLFFRGQDYVAVPDMGSLQPQDLTLEGYFRFYAPFSGKQVLFSKATGSGSQSFEVWYDGSKLHAAVGDFFGLETGLSADWTPASGVWYHIAFSYDQATGAEVLSIDGASVATGMSSVTQIAYDPSRPLLIGAEYSGGTYGSYFFGMADDVKVSGGATLLASYGFDTVDQQANPPTTPDGSGNNHTGFVFGTPLVLPSSAPLASSSLDLSQSPDIFTSVYNITPSTPNTGEFRWTIPNDETLPPDQNLPLPGNYRMLITRTDDTDVKGTSYADFTIVPKSHVYYVNDDTVLPGDTCLVPGNDANDGLTPETPKASIAAVLYDYVLGPGDLILVDDGHYLITTNTLLDSRSNGYTIRGFHDPAHPDRVALLDRDNPNPQRYALEFTGATHITLDQLVFTGGDVGVYGDPGSNSAYLTVSNCTFYGNVSSGIDLENSNDHATFIGNLFEGGAMANGLIAHVNYATVTSNTVTGPIGYGLAIVGDNAAITQNTVSGAGTAISVSGANAVVSHNTIADSSTGIGVIGDNAQVDYNTITGGGTGISVSGNHAVVDHNTITGGSAGIAVGGNDAQVTYNTAADDGSGISVTGSDMLVGHNTAYGGSSGVTASGTGQVSDNTAHDETATGFSAEGSPLLVINNLAYNSGFGFFLGGGVRATQNLAHDNTEGFVVDYYRETATIDHNRGYANYGVGVHGRGQTAVLGNDLYNNGVGILGERGNTYLWVGTVANNLVYNDGTQGIWIRQGQDAPVTNNTVYEPGAADAVTVDTASTGVRLRNNILWVMAGHDLNVAADSEIGFTSDYNDLYTTGAGLVGEWEGDPFPAYLDWFYSVGQDVHSLNVDPGFVDPAGPDGVLGGGVSPSGPALTLDDSSPGGFQLQGNWNAQTGAGYNGDYQLSDPADSSDLARYTFSGLTPGVYQLAATWPVAGGGLARYRVTGGTWSGMSFAVDQAQPPSGFTSGGVPWQVLGVLYVTGPFVTVELTPQAGPPHAIVADGLWLQPLQVTDNGPDDNFHLQPGAPAVDEGDPASAFIGEPAPNGGRVNLGYDGNTPQAQTSPSPLLQVLSPNGNEKLEVTDTYTITWRSDGIVAPPGYYTGAVLQDNPTAYYRLDEPAGPTAEDFTGNGNAGTYADSGVTYQVHGALPSDPDPAAGFDGESGAVTLPQGFIDYSNGFSFEVWAYPTAGNADERFLSLGDDNPSDLVEFGRAGSTNDLVFLVGSQTVTASNAVSLNEWQYFAVTVDQFGSVTLYKNGQQVVTGTAQLPFSGPTHNYLARGQDTGGSGGGGLGGGGHGGLGGGGGGGGEQVVYFGGDLDEAAFYGSALSSERIQDHYQHRLFGTVNIDLLQVGNPTPIPVASGVANDGAYDWTVPADLPLDQNYRIRITSVEQPAAVGFSNSPFLITNDGTSFYINDSSPAGDQYTTGPGLDTNSGKTPDRPMKTLAALMDAYHPGAGDTIFVDAGTYRLYRAVLVRLEDSGVHIVGPTDGATALNNRGNENPQIYAFDFRGAADVLFDRLTVTGGRVGLYAGAGLGAPGLTVSHSTFYDNQDAGIDLVGASPGITIDHNTFYATGEQRQDNGLLANGGDATVTFNTVTGPTGTGLEVTGTGAHFANNTVTWASGDGIAATGDSAVATSNTVTFSGTGIDIQGSGAQVATNTLAHDGTGIAVGGDSAQVTSNAASACGTGISVWGGSAQVGSNTVSTSGTGISVQGDYAQVTDNILANDTTGAAVNGSSMSVTGNSAYGGSTGFSLNGSGQAGSNLARDESSTGIYAVGNIVVSNNTAYRDGTGVVVGGTARATQNLVHHNSVDGIATDYESDTATIDHNRVFANLSDGIHARGQTDVTGNDVYGDAVGILGEPGRYHLFVGTVANNLTYQDANQGILIHTGSGAQVLNNTVYQPVGDSVRVDTGSTGIRLRNNILWVLRGYDLYVTPESEVGLDSDYNLLYATTGDGLSGQVASWEGDGFPTLASWFYGLGQDAHSVSADPRFVDIDGPDDILGYDSTGGSAPVILDDSSPDGFQLQGTWGAHTGDGYNGNYQLSDPADGTDLATYTRWRPAGRSRAAGAWPPTPSSTWTRTSAASAPTRCRRRTTSSSASSGGRTWASTTSPGPPSPSGWPRRPTAGRSSPTRSSCSGSTATAAPTTTSTCSPPHPPSTRATPPRRSPASRRPTAAASTWATTATRPRRPRAPARSCRSSRPTTAPSPTPPAAPWTTTSRSTSRGSRSPSPGAATASRPARPPTCTTRPPAGRAGPSSPPGSRWTAAATAASAGPSPSRPPSGTSTACASCPAAWKTFPTTHSSSPTRATSSTSTTARPRATSTPRGPATTTTAARRPTGRCGPWRR